MQTGEASIARRQSAIPPHAPPPRARGDVVRTGGNGAQPPASTLLTLGFSLLRLSGPARLVIGGIAALLLWLCIAWVLA
jgi:hypothetical protein